MILIDLNASFVRHPTTGIAPHLLKADRRQAINVATSQPVSKAPRNESLGDFRYVALLTRNDHFPTNGINMIHTTDSPSEIPPIVDTHVSEADSSPANPLTSAAGEPTTNAVCTEFIRPNVIDGKCGCSKEDEFTIVASSNRPTRSSTISVGRDTRDADFRRGIGYAEFAISQQPTGPWSTRRCIDEDCLLRSGDNRSASVAFLVSVPLGR